MKRFILKLSVLSILFCNFAEAQIPLLIEERANITRIQEPVTLGVPFAKGALMSSMPIRIVNPNRTPVDAQFKTMAVWDDGSIKWLKCDFQADVNAKNTAQYSLELNAIHSPSTELIATETSTEITVTTGPLRFIVSKINFNLINQAWLDLNSDRMYTNDEIIISDSASIGPMVSAGGLNYLASVLLPEKIEIEEQGPMKVVIKISGKHYNNSNYLLKYETRIYAFADQSFIKIWHVYANGTSVESLGESGNPNFGTSFDRYSLDLKINLSGSKSVIFGGDDGSIESFILPTGETASLVQSDRNNTTVPLSYSIQVGSSVQSSGSRSDGWCDFRNNKWGLLIGSRYFWQKYPKGLKVNDYGKISFEPAPTSEFLWAGMGTGDLILLHFHPAIDTSTIQQFAMGLVKQPLFARTTPQQYINSEAFYSLQQDTSSSYYTAMNNYINEVSSNHLSNIENLQLYGNINFGDVTRDRWEVAPFVDESTWGNNYYDCILTAARLFAQTGDLNYVNILVPMAWHFMETNCWNTYNSNDWLNGFSASYGSYHRDIGHFQQHYGEGIWYYYYLTGDERAREIGLRAAQSIVNQQWWANENVDCRMAYQRGSACLEAWKNTRDSAYLNHARHLLIDKILATQDIYGLIGGSYEEGGPHMRPEQTFMMALYSDALWKYIKELNLEDINRQSLIGKIVKLADLFDTYARKISGQEDYWNIWSIPNNNQPPQPLIDWSNPDFSVYWNGKGLITGTYAYAYDFTGNKKYKTLAKNLLNNVWLGGAFGEEFWGKASSQAMKNMIHAVAILSDFVTSVDENNNVPKRFILQQNYPNPFNSKTKIEYVLDNRQNVELMIYDVLGQEITKLINEVKESGRYSVVWDGENEFGNTLPSGVFIYKIKAGEFTQAKKMILLR